MRSVAALIVAVLVCVAADVQSTWSAFPYRPQTWDLPWQTAVVWGGLALLVSLPAVWAGRRWNAPFVAWLVCLAAPVVLHGAVRTPLRAGQPVWLPALLVLLGVAVVAILGGRLERAVHRRGRRTAAGLALLLAALAVAAPTGGQSYYDDVDPGRTRHPAPEGRPHLLLLVWDTTRADRTSPYGADPELTPNLARLAEQGTVYDWSWSSSMFTLSSHASLLTGLPPALHGTTLRQQAVHAPALPGFLSRAGYRTGAFVGTSVLVGGRGLERDFDVYDDQVDPPVCDTRAWALVHDVQAAAARVFPSLRGNGLPHWFQDFQRPAAGVLDGARAFAFADDRRPWFMMVNLFDVHWPYLPGDASRDRFAGAYSGPLDGYLFRSDDYPDGYEPDTEDKAYVRGLYDAEMWELDAAVDRFLDELGLDAGDVCVVMTSDHGEGLGERGLWSHDEFVEPQTRVPLIVFAPGRAEAGARVTTHVSGMDVAPTLLSLANVPPPDPPLPGTALVDGPPPEDRFVFVQDHDNPRSANDGDAVIRGRFKLVSRGGKRTLHDLHEDPLDEHDLTAGHPEVAAELGAALDALLAARTATDGEMGNLDALRALGYMGN